MITPQKLVVYVSITNNIDGDAIKSELKEFKVIYKSMEKDIDISNLLPKPKIEKGKGKKNN